MKLVKVSETPTTITLGWDPVPGADGYLFYKDGVRVSKTFDPNRRTVQFSKPGKYRVEAVAYNVLAAADYPSSAPVYKKVAPKTANKEGGSDARFCLVGQPGVVEQPDGTYRDDVARYDSNGLHLGGRSDACTQSVTPGLVGAKSMDGREPCQLTPVGNPQENTGSWTV